MFPPKRNILFYAEKIRCLEGSQVHTCHVADEWADRVGSCTLAELKMQVIEELQKPGNDISYT